MGLIPAFDPSTGASGGPAPAPAPAAADGAPKLVIDTDFQASPTVDMSTVGTFTVDGIEWTTTAAVATTAEADSTGLVVSSDDSTATGFVTQIPNIAKGDFVCIAVVFDNITAWVANTSTLLVKLASVGGDTDSEYDLFMTMRRGSSTWRARNAFRGSSSWTAAYVGDNPFSGSMPTRVVMMLYGSGYSYTTAISTDAGVPDFRAVTATNNAGGSLRSRANGQTQMDTDPPLLQYLKLVFNSYGGDMAAKITSVRVWVGARVIS